MAFQEDLSAFFGPDDPGVSAAVFNAATTVYGEFKDAYADPLDFAEGAAPHFWCALSDVPAVKHGDTFLINAVTYTVRGVRPDGTGIVEIRLEH